MPTKGFLCIEGRPLGWVGVSGDFSVLEVRAVEITESVYELTPKNLVHERFKVFESPYPPKRPPFDT